jgi:hypothetical protein
MFAFALGFAAGGALIWFFKDKVTSLYKSTEDQIGALNDKIKALKGE